MYKSQANFLFTIVIASTLILGFASCNNSEPNFQDEIQQVDLTRIATGTDVIKLSELAKSVSYIQLETSTECVFTASEYIMRGDKIFVRDRDNEKVFLFNRQGKFIRQIGRIGPGPQEYIGANYMQVSSQGDTVFLLCTKVSKLYSFSDEGLRLSAVKNHYSSWKFAPLANGSHILLTPWGYPHPDSASFLFYVQNEQGQVSYKNHNTRIATFGDGKFDLGRFFVNPISTLVYQPFSDTITSLNPQGEMIPKYAMDFGKFRFPDALWDDKTEFRKQQDNYFNWLSLTETQKSLFIYFYYNKTRFAGVLTLQDNGEGEIRGGPGMMVNDLDGGPDFWPNKSDGKKLVYTLLQPVKLVEQWQNGEFENKEFKNKTMQKALMNMLNNLDESDNPILMVVELR